MKIDGDIKKIQAQTLGNNQTAVVNMVATLLTKSQETGGTIPPDLKPMVDAVINNIMIGAISATQDQKQDLAQKMQAAQQMQMAQQQQEQQQPEQQEQGQMEEQQPEQETQQPEQQNNQPPQMTA